MMLVGVAIAVLSVLVLVCLLALVDQHRSIEAVRRHLNATTKPQAISYRRSRQSLTELGLPARLDKLEHLVLIFLSTSCTACRSLARPLGKAPPDNMWIVLEAPSTAAGTRWLSGVGLPDRNVTIEENQQVISAFGVEVTPAVLVFRNGDPVVGQTAPSYEHLEPLLLAAELPSFLTETAEEVPAI